MREEGRSQSTKLNTFKNILEQELDSNFDDSIVIGGIDAFIEKWKVELSSNLGDLPAYSKLSKSKRKSWISSVLKKIKEVDIPQNTIKSNCPCTVRR